MLDYVFFVKGGSRKQVVNQCFNLKKNVFKYFNIIFDFIVIVYIPILKLYTIL